MPRFLQRAIIKTHQWLYVRTDGRFGANLFGRPMLLLRTIGRRTGLPRTVALLYVPEGDGYGVIASNSGSRRNPGWFHNLMAAPDAEIQIRRDRIAVRARVVDGEHRRAIFGQADEMIWGIYRGYQKRTERRIPVVLLEPC